MSQHEQVLAQIPKKTTWKVWPHSFIHAAPLSYSLPTCIELCASFLLSAWCSLSVKNCENLVTCQWKVFLLGRPHTCLITSCWRGAVVTHDESVPTEPMNSSSFSCTQNNPLTACRHHALDEIVFLDVYLLHGETWWVVAKYSLFLLQNAHLTPNET